MPGWLRRKLSGIADEIADDVLDKIQDHVSHLDLGPTVNRIKDTGIRCHSLAKDTSELCQSTETVSHDMLEVGQDLMDTLKGATADGVTADTFDTIQEILGGEKLQSALGLAKTMNKQAFECVEKSVEMMDLMEGAIDDLPDPIERAIDKALERKPAGQLKANADGDTPAEAISAMDKDIEDVQTCLRAIKELNLFTALEVGSRALTNFKEKAEVSQDAFRQMRGFSETITEVTRSFQTLNVKGIIRNVKELWKCLKLTTVMKELAQAVGNLTNLVIRLFKETSSKVSGLWKALAFAKNVMMECVETVKDAKGLILSTLDDSAELMNVCMDILKKMQQVGTFDGRGGSIKAVRDLADGDEFRAAIKIATNMDDLVLACIEKAVSMVLRLQDSYKNLPPIVTKGIPLDDADGAEDDDPAPADVEDNISDLVSSQRSIEDADMLRSVDASVRGFSDVTDKIGTSKELLDLLQGFAENCMRTINSFMGVWDLETATDKIRAIRRMTSLGEQMKQFSEQIKRLVLAMIALIETTMNKLKKSLDMKHVASEVREHVGDAVDMVKKVNIKKIGASFKKLF